jgi:hypothetical protein
LARRDTNRWQLVHHHQLLPTDLAIWNRGSSFTYDGNARSFLLGVETHRIKTAYQFDPLFAGNSSADEAHKLSAYEYGIKVDRSER